MDRIKMAKLAKYLADNDIDPHEAVQVLQEACRQMVLARLEKETSEPKKKPKIYDLTGMTKKKAVIEDYEKR